MNERDQYLQSQVVPTLMPGEQVLHTAYVVEQPGLIWQMLLLGGLLLFLITKAYFAVMTNRRLILIRTKQSFWTGGPKLMNLGVQAYDAMQLQTVTTSGLINNRSMTFRFRDGSSRTVRVFLWPERVTGTKAFFEMVPNLIGSGQLAGMAAAAAGAMGPGAPGPMPMPMAAPPGPGGQLAPGAPVSVLWSDGNRYAATVVQLQEDQCLCAMQSGQQQWVPVANVTPA